MGANFLVGEGSFKCGKGEGQPQLRCLLGIEDVVTNSWFKNYRCRKRCVWIHMHISVLFFFFQLCMLRVYRNRDFLLAVRIPRARSWFLNTLLYQKETWRSDNSQAQSREQKMSQEHLVVPESKIVLKRQNNGDMSKRHSQPKELPLANSGTIQAIE